MESTDSFISIDALFCGIQGGWQVEQTVRPLVSNMQTIIDLPLDVPDGVPEFPNDSFYPSRAQGQRRMQLIGHLMKLTQKDDTGFPNVSN